MSLTQRNVACVARGQKSWRRSRERNGAEAAEKTGGFPRGFAAKTFDPSRTKPPATQAKRNDGS